LVTEFLLAVTTVRHRTSRCSTMSCPMMSCRTVNCRRQRRERCSVMPKCPRCRSCL